MDKNFKNLIDRLNDNQTILRLKFFGGYMFGQVHYFVPEWLYLDQ